MLPQLYGDKIKGLKELYAFRMLLKAKVSAYKKAIGVEPDHEQLKQVLYVCMDSTSKNLASETGLDGKPYLAIGEDIDRRYRLQFGVLDFAKPQKGDDPMGLSNVSEAQWAAALGVKEEPAASTPAPTATEKSDLDAVNKGKGKGKGCHPCGGDGHYARDCPSQLPLTNVQCNACHGKGHYARESARPPTRASKAPAGKAVEAAGIKRVEVKARAKVAKAKAAKAKAVGKDYTRSILWAHGERTRGEASGTRTAGARARSGSPLTYLTCDD